MIRKIFLWFFMIVMVFTFTGCFGAKDLTEVSISSGFGIDQEKDGKFTLSVQILNPAVTQGSGSKGGGGEEKSFIVVSNTGDTVFAALRGMLNKVENKIFYSSSQIIVIGESVAKAGIKDAIDFILRDHETQYKTLVVTTKGVTAKEILEQKYELTKIPGGFIESTIKNSVSTGFTKETRLLELARELATQGKDLCLPTISKAEDTTQTEGLAVFLEDQSVGFLDKYEARGFLFGTGEEINTIVEVENPSDPKKKIGIEIQKNSAKKKLEWDKEGSPIVTIDIKASGNISEQSEVVDIKEDELVKRLEESCNKKIEEEVLATLKKCQKDYNSDIFGFGAKVFDEKPDYWKEVKEKWSKEIYPNIEVRIEVDTKILRTGLIKKSLDVK